MNTWIYYEFVHTVHFPGDRACNRAENGKHYNRSKHESEGVVFTCANDAAVFVPWANVRYAGGCVTPQVVTDNVTVTLPDPAAPARKTSKKL